MKLEPGMLCRVIDGDLRKDLIGEIVILKKEILRKDHDADACPGCKALTSWETNIFGWGTCSCCLEPINPDHKPCEDDFKQDLKLWLKGKVDA